MKYRELPTYFITIRAHKVKDPVTCCKLSAVLNHLRHKVPFHVINTCFEKDPTYNQLHAHAIVRSLHPIWYKGLTSYSGFRVFYQALDFQRDIHKAQVYCAKDQYQTYSFTD